MVTDIPKTFGWVGLGAMGYPMAVRLRRKIAQSSQLYIYDIDDKVIDRFMEEMTGFEVKAMKSSKDVADRSDFVITIVPEGSHVKAVYLDSEVGLLAAQNTSSKIFVDCSTIDPATSRAVGEAVIKSSTLQNALPAKFFDAPVSGGTAGASKGSLTFMVGAALMDPDFPLLKEIFSCMGTSIQAMGGPSLGLAAKLSNNYLSGIIALATSEAMNLGMRLGLEPKVLSDCIATSSGANWVNSTINPVPGVCPKAVTSKGYHGGFKIQLMKKDMSLAIDAARQVDAKLVLGGAGLAAYSEAADDLKCRDKDSRVVYRWLGGKEPDVVVEADDDS